ncbi:DUF3977 family protein [Streptococcus ovuberis]|uniref:DUF3977 family protein n=1 Tax=Streptococcus ovuberis TaxID=1936207 RepID=A0A7X6S016_9STRE|nr:DUF3977 family protein [Streptococcus ovuberis]NKZ19639.1 DUF3977 family protein [Streptococcus ovuberis]
MTKYLEIGFGNRWFMRTAFEADNGTEHEVKGWVRPIVPLVLFAGILNIIVIVACMYPCWLDCSL